MAADICLPVILFLGLIPFISAGRAKLTITPQNLHLPFNKSLDISCRKIVSARGMVCKMALFKTSIPCVSVTSQDGTQGQACPVKQFLAEVENGLPVKLLDSQSTMSVYGSTSRGILRVKVMEATCEHDGYYACHTSYDKSSLGSASPLDMCDAENDSSFVNSVWDLAAAAVSITVSAGQVSLTASFNRTNTSDADIILNCTVQTTEEIRRWNWEIDVYGHGQSWVKVEDVNHTIQSGVIAGQTSACRQHYSTMSGLLKLTDVGRQYRCYVSTSTRDLDGFAAYFTVPLSAVQGILARENDDLQSRKEKDSELVGHSSKDAVLIAVPVLCGMIFLALAVIGACRLFKNVPAWKAHEHTTLSDLPLDLMGRLPVQAVPDTRRDDLSSFTSGEKPSSPAPHSVGGSTVTASDVSFKVPSYSGFTQASSAVDTRVSLEGSSSAGSTLVSSKNSSDESVPLSVKTTREKMDLLTVSDDDDD